MYMYKYYSRYLIYIILYYTIVYQIISYYIMLCRIISYQIILCYIISCDVIVQYSIVQCSMAYNGIVGYMIVRYITCCVVYHVYVVSQYIMLQQMMLYDNMRQTSRLQHVIEQCSMLCDVIMLYYIMMYVYMCVHCAEVPHLYVYMYWNPFQL